MKHWLKRIYSDPFDICDRLKSIDEGYYVVYNVKRDKYEVHNFFYADTFCFVVPYKSLDSRTIDYCLKTRRQNAKKIFDEIDEQNAKLEAEEKKKLMESSEERIKRIVKEYGL